VHCIHFSVFRPESAGAANNDTTFENSIRPKDPISRKSVPFCWLAHPPTDNNWNFSFQDFNGDGTKDEVVNQVEYFGQVCKSSISYDVTKPWLTNDYVAKPVVAQVEKQMFCCRVAPWHAFAAG
jgi:hypothetical protein